MKLLFQPYVCTLKHPYTGQVKFISYCVSQLKKKIQKSLCKPATDVLPSEISPQVYYAFEKSP